MIYYLKFKIIAFNGEYNECKILSGKTGRIRMLFVMFSIMQHLSLYDIREDSEILR